MGDNPELLRQLDQMGETFILDIHKDQTIYLSDPAPYTPKKFASWQNADSIENRPSCYRSLPMG